MDLTLIHHPALPGLEGAIPPKPAGTIEQRIEERIWAQLKKGPRAAAVFPIIYLAVTPEMPALLGAPYKPQGHPDRDFVDTLVYEAFERFLEPFLEYKGKKGLPAPPLDQLQLKQLKREFLTFIHERRIPPLPDPRDQGRRPLIVRLVEEEFRRRYAPLPVPYENDGPKGSTEDERRMSKLIAEFDAHPECKNLHELDEVRRREVREAANAYYERHGGGHQPADLPETKG